MQEQLDDLYIEYLKRILSEEDILDMINSHELSSPQLLDISAPRANYIQSDYKIVFIGKETNGWFNRFERQNAGLTTINGQYRQYLEELKKIYKKHNIGENYRKPIFTFIDLLTERTNQIKNTGIILTELLRHDYNQEGASYQLAVRLAYDNNYILRKEIEILRPNAVVFLTGPNYDMYISHTYPQATFHSYNDYDLRQVAIIEGITNIGKAVRIYHPNAHSPQGWEFRYDMIEIITKILNI